MIKGQKARILIVAVLLLFFVKTDVISEVRIDHKKNVLILNGIKFYK
jgi:hypothetical protein